MDREEYIKERNFTTNTDYLQSITDGEGAGQWEAAWAGQTSAEHPADGQESEPMSWSQST